MDFDTFDFDLASGDSLMAWGLNTENDEPIAMDVVEDDDLQIKCDIENLLDVDLPKKSAIPENCNSLYRYGFQTLCELYPDECKRFKEMKLTDKLIHKALVLKSIDENESKVYKL